MKRFSWGLFLALGLASALAQSAALKKEKGAGTLKRKVAHLFNRLAFGARPGEAEAVLAKGQAGIDHWIERQLNPDPKADPSAEKKVAALKAPKMTGAELLNHFQKPAEVAMKMGIEKDKFDKDPDLRKTIQEQIGKDNLPEEIVREMTAQKLIRAVESQWQLQEMLVDFWFNHFNVDITKGEMKWMVPTYEREVIRQHLFGHFGDLLRATAHSPAMLFYLDNHLSQSPLAYDAQGHAKENKKPRGTGLNENYAREIIELHTLGVDGGYTQQDVTELARILTGWSIDGMKTDPIFKFKENVHDRGEKKFLGQIYAAGEGQAEGERALTQLSEHPSTAKFIATKLCRLFVSDAPPPSLVHKVQQRFIATKGNLKQVYLTLFRSPEFWSERAFHDKIKKPLHFVVSAIRALGGELDLDTHLPKLLGAMGEEPYHCPPPTGYRETAATWVNPGAMVNRLRFALSLAANKVEGVYVQLPATTAAPGSVASLVAALSTKLLHDRLSESSQRIILEEIGADNQTMGDGEIRPLSLTKVVGMTLGSPEFQRR